MAKKKETVVEVTHDPDMDPEDIIYPNDAIIKLIEVIENNNLVEAKALVQRINKYFPDTGSLSVKYLLTPEFNTINATSLFVAKNLKCLSDKDEVIFYQLYAMDTRSSKSDSINFVLSKDKGYFDKSIYFDAMRLAIRLNNYVLVSKIQEKLN